MPSAHVCISYHQNSVKDNFIFHEIPFFSLINLTFDSSTNISSSTFKIYPGFLCLYFFLSYSLLSWFKLLSSLTWIIATTPEWVFLLCLSEYSQYNIQSHPVKMQIKSYNSSARKRPVAYHLRVNVQILSVRP